MKRSFFIPFMLFLFTLLTVLSAFFEILLSKKQTYVSLLLDSEFDAEVYKAIDDTVEIIGDQVALDSEKLKKIILKTDITKHAHEYTSAILESALETGKPPVYPAFDFSPSMQDLKLALDDYYSDFDITYTDEELDSLYKYIELNVKLTLEYFPSSFLPFVQSIEGYVSAISVFASYFPLYAIITVFLCVLLFFFNKRIITEALSPIISALLSAGIIFFIPFVMIKKLFISVKLTLDDTLIGFVASDSIGEITNMFLYVFGEIIVISFTALLALTLIDSIKRTKLQNAALLNDDKAEGVVSGAHQKKDVIRR